MKRLVLIFYLVFLGLITVTAQNKVLKHESDGFKWYLLTDENGEKEGAMDINGKILIPFSAGYDFVSYKKGQFMVFYSSGSNTGYYSKEGKIIIHPKKYDDATYIDGKDGNWYCVEKNGKEGACDIYGNELVPPKYRSIYYYSDEGFKYEDKYGGLHKLNIFLPSESENKAINFAQNSSGNSVSLVEKAKDYFYQAYNLPDDQMEEKARLYGMVINSDPNNETGYSALAYNNVGVLFDQCGDTKKAKEFFEKALELSPNNEQASANLKAIKKKRRNERWNKFSNALGVMSNALQDVNNSVSGNSSYSNSSSNDSYQSVDIYGSSSSSYNSSANIRKCSQCAGTGTCSGGTKASAKYHCHGSGKCGWCNGNGYNYTAGHPVTCTRCKGKGKCTYCNGTGKCTACHGTGRA